MLGKNPIDPKLRRIGLRVALLELVSFLSGPKIVYCLSIPSTLALNSPFSCTILLIVDFNVWAKEKSETIVLACEVNACLTSSVVTESLEEMTVADVK
ncbi:Uncharacterised protein [Chlamydia trachomatis]|nr:Uncharacterised protein [Chlamydia trachomatis]